MQQVGIFRMFNYSTVIMQMLHNPMLKVSFLIKIKVRHNKCQRLNSQKFSLAKIASIIIKFCINIRVLYWRHERWHQRPFSTSWLASTMCVWVFSLKCLQSEIFTVKWLSLFRVLCERIEETIYSHVISNLQTEPAARDFDASTFECRLMRTLFKLSFSLYDTVCNTEGGKHQIHE